MRLRLLSALGAGFLVALGVAGFPATAADAVIAAHSAGPNSAWNPSTASIKVGESVTWTNDGGNAHNVCIQTPGTSGSTCTEALSGPATTTWTQYSHQFTAPGTYTFFCKIHGTPTSGMYGTVTVTAASTGTGTTPPPYTPPTDTTTGPVQTQTQTTPSDTTAPAFTGKLKRRASRKSLIFELTSTEAATLKASVYRRSRNRHAFTRISRASLKVKQGKNVVTLPRKPKSRLRSGAYRVKLQLIDAAGNKSATKTVSFKLT